MTFLLEVHFYVIYLQPVYGSTATGIRYSTKQLLLSDSHFTTLIVKHGTSVSVIPNDGIDLGQANRYFI